MAGKIVQVDARHPDPAVLERAAAILQKGGLVVLPTSGLYGLAAMACDPAAVARVVRIKGRQDDKPILVLISQRAQLAQVALEIPPAGERLIKAFWPGAVTLVVKVRAGLPRPLTTGSGKIGVRQVAHPLTSALIDRLESPVTGTSANCSGHPAAADVTELAADIIAGVDLVLDAGPLRGGRGSSVVDVTVSPCVMLREGVVSRQHILQATSP